MILSEIVDKLKLEVLVNVNMDYNIELGYVCDLLSEVMGKAKSDSIWITVHTNMNIVGVASMLDIKAIIIAEGHKPGDEVIDRAKDEGIAILSSKQNSFNISGLLYELGVRG